MKTKNVSVALVEKEGKILMGMKAPDVGPYPNTWRLPGGKIEDGESEVDALIREVKEETNLDVDSYERIGTYEDDEPDKHGELTHWKFHIYKVLPAGELKSSDEFPEVKWFDIKDLPNVSSVARASIKLFQDLGYL